MQLIFVRRKIVAAGGTPAIAYAAATSDSGASTSSAWTFSSVAIGSSSHVAVGAWGIFSAARDWASIDVGGNSTSSLVSSGSAQGVCCVGIVANPGGSTATITVTHDSTNAGIRGGIIVWEVDNIASTTPVASGNANSHSSNIVSTGSMTASGPLVWCAIAGTNSSGDRTVTWSEGTKDAEVYTTGRTMSGASNADADGFSSTVISGEFSAAPTLPALALAAWG